MILTTNIKTNKNQRTTLAVSHLLNNTKLFLNTCISKQTNTVKNINHLATMSGDFFGSKSSKTSSNPGYCINHKSQISVNRSRKQVDYNIIHITSKQNSSKHLISNTLSNFSLHRSLDLILPRHIFCGKPNSHITHQHM